MPYHVMRVVLITAILACLPAAAAAQQDPMDPHWRGYQDAHHRNECRLANQVLTRGQPANQREWALGIIVTCGPLGGSTIAQLLRDHRTEEEWGEELELVVNLTWPLHDRSIYEAAFEIATDPNAGTAARVQALRVLYYQISPGSRDPYETFLPESMTSHFPAFHGPRVGDPLPKDALQELLIMARAIVDDAAVDERIRSAATKLMIAAEVEAACAGTKTLEECANRILDGGGSR